MSCCEACHLALGKPQMQPPPLPPPPSHAASPLSHPSENSGGEMQKCFRIQAQNSTLTWRCPNERDIGFYDETSPVHP
ncbi:hypothetical protein E2C01_020464 [Portunus trituberculatus]|uniref:Uncharacterized protein n=1 Tax=Portunus trituberculatus TaxID=210409 RepID=A0A5B7E2C7_PORTR|nr:hypothetical protein [Portunus trituberculatus]